MKVVTTGNFKDLIQQLRIAQKDGYKSLDEVKYMVGFFRAVLQKEVDEGYLQRLDKIDENIKENVLDLIDSLNTVPYSTPKEPQPVKKGVGDKQVRKPRRKKVIIE